MIWCILIPLITGLICGILGYLIGRMNSSSGDNISDYIKKINALEVDLEHCRKSKNVTAKVSGNEQMNLANNFQSAAITLIPFNGDLAKSIFGKKIKENDLTLVEGIGPKISELFNNSGVNTWYDLSQCSEVKCQEILNSGGKRFEIHKPKTWPQQAKLATEGKWQELKDWQDQLDGGK